MKLVVVESPAKCKKLENFLGREFRVIASMGHFRDLPGKGFGVDLQTMEPNYEVHKPDVVSRIKRNAEKADIIYLCTDPDREGEAIAWHLKCVLPENKIYRRATFQEITKKAVLKAIENYGDLNEHLVDAQQARRILDRIVGYKLSPELWNAFKNEKSLSAGRVQSAATRLVVDREREIKAFVEEVYYKIYSHHEKDGLKFRAELKKIIQKEKRKTLRLLDAKVVSKWVEKLKDEDFIVDDVQKKSIVVKPQPPFTTSNMQAKAAHILNIPAVRSMKAAQKLYEAGHITYHRTDSTHISDEAVQAVRAYILERFNEKYLPKKAHRYANKAGAQEAHECIRPTRVEIEELSNMGQEEKKLYQLIRQQFISCQMSSGKDALTMAHILAGDALFETRGRVELFDGYRILNRQDVQEKSSKKKEEESAEKQKLPDMKKGDRLELLKLESKKLKTKPPPRFTEASLIKKLEKEGIGRPSTYTTIVGTIVSRGYVSLKGKKYFAEPLGMKVTDYLVQRFSTIMKIDFTRISETRLDAIAEGKLDWITFLQNFWSYFSKQLLSRQGVVPQTQREPMLKHVSCTHCGKKTVFQESAKWKGRYFFCCHFCKCYLEANDKGEPLSNSHWLKKLSSSN